MQPLEITDHAERRMMMRGVPLEAVTAVLANYHTSRPAGRRPGVLPAVIYTGTYEGRNLKVYVERDSNPPRVTTVVWEGD